MKKKKGHAINQSINELIKVVINERYNSTGNTITTSFIDVSLFHIYLGFNERLQQHPLPVYNC